MSDQLLFIDFWRKKSLEGLRKFEKLGGLRSLGGIRKIFEKKLLCQEIGMEVQNLLNKSNQKINLHFPFSHNFQNFSMIKCTFGYPNYFPFS